jgi:hypothetical protein
MEELIAVLDSPKKSGHFDIYNFPFGQHQISHRRLFASILHFMA